MTLNAPQDWLRRNHTLRPEAEGVTQRDPRDARYLSLGDEEKPYCSKASGLDEFYSLISS